MTFKNGGSVYRIAAAAIALQVAPMLSAPAHGASPVRHSPPFTATNLISLPRDRLLIWERNGQAQIRDSDGTWTPAFELPMRDVIKVVPDGAGFMALGLRWASGSGDKYPIVAFDAAGKETDRWSADPVWDLSVDDSGRWAMTENASMIPLLPGGKFGPVEPIPEWTGQPHREPRFSPLPLHWHRLHWQGITVYCHDADLSKQGAALARCERPGPGGWAYTGGWALSDSVSGCGPWLVLREGKRSEQLAIIDRATGKLAGRSRYRERPVISCAGADELAVGSRRLELLQLPSLKLRWRSDMLPGPVLALAVLDNYLAYRLGPGFDVLVIPRPKPSSP